MRWMKNPPQLIASTAVAVLSYSAALSLFSLKLNGKFAKPPAFEIAFPLCVALLLAAFTVAIYKRFFGFLLAFFLLFNGLAGLGCGVWMLHKHNALLAAAPAKAVFFWITALLLAVGYGLFTYLWERRLDDAM